MGQKGEGALLGWDDLVLLWPHTLRSRTSSVSTVVPGLCRLPAALGVPEAAQPP